MTKHPVPRSQKKAFRMYTQHNVFFIMYITSLAASILLPLMFWTGFIDTEDRREVIVVSIAGLFGGAIGPVMGLIFLMQRGPLRIDPEAATLTYRRHVYPFERLDLVRVGALETLLPSFSSIESGGAGDASTITVGVVASGDFILSPDDQLPRRRLVKLANALNDALADYWQSKGEPLAPIDASVESRV